MRVSKVFISAALFACATAVSLPTYAATAGSIKVSSVAQTEVEVSDAQGKKHVERVPVAKAVPGTVVLYVNSFENVGKKPAGDVVMVNPIPANTEYQVGSAYGENTEITFSVDGGKNFAYAEKLKVKDANGQEHLAKADQYTHVRWAYKGMLAVDAKGEVGFKVTIK